MDGGFLSDRLGPGFTLLAFDPALAVSHAELDTVILPPGSDAAQLLAAGPRTAYLVRPDGHVAARWTEAETMTIRTALDRALGGDMHAAA